MAKQSSKCDTKTWIPSSLLLLVIATLKMIVESEPHQVRGETVIRSRHREAAIVEIEIKPLGFTRPMSREAYLGAKAGGPAHAGMAL